MFGIELGPKSFEGLKSILASKFKNKMKEDYKPFVDMLRDKIGESNSAWPVIMKMTHMLEDNDAFEDMMEICQGVEAFKEYLTESEAKRTDSAS